MKIRISALLVVLFNIIFAQNHRYIYDFEYKKDSTSTLTTKENYHLDILGEKTTYYKRDFFIADSLTNIPPEMKLSVSPIITSKLGSNDYEMYEILESTVILNLKTEAIQKWELSDEKKSVAGLTLQKATTNWGGRNWIAWFAPKIPFQEGPRTTWVNR